MSTQHLDYDAIRIRAEQVVIWWQNACIDSANDLLHETNLRCGNVNNWLRKLEIRVDERTTENRLKFILCIKKAELWICALQYKGKA